jgi:hypothetical protein
MARINDRRGNSTDRANRKRWMLITFGDGVTCKCVHCDRELNYDTVEADRKMPGGPYARWNIQPSDRHCNASRGNNLNWISPNAKSVMA